MATTTNYGWTTPDDTALVKDGASAIRTLGSSVDTTVKALNPGTTAGDLDYYTAATTKARIAKGTAGQVFTMNSGATAPEWTTISTGSMTLLSTTSLSGATPTISSISGAYTDLVAVIYGVTNATADGNFRCDVNSSLISTQSGTEKTNTYQSITTSIRLSQANFTRTDANNVVYLRIHNYANTSFYKPFTVYGNYLDTAGAVRAAFNTGGGVQTNSAITSLLFKNTGGDISTGTVLLYGVK
jgi:hypothetical protein